jgi:hypothetical protein
MKMLKIIAVLALVTSCAKDAPFVPAGNGFVERENVVGLSADNIGKAKEVVDGEEVRSITMLIYPNSNDLKGFTFSPAEDKKDSWDQFLASINYAKMIKTNYAGMSANDMAVQTIFTVVSAGESRDNAFYDRYVTRKNRLALEAQKEELSTPPEELQNSLDQLKKDLKPFSVCFYKKSEAPSSDEESYLCKTKKDGDYKKKKKARNKCERTFRYNFIDLDEEEAIAFAEMKDLCLQTQAELENFLSGSESKIQQVETQISASESEERRLFILREAGKSVVLDLLQTAETYRFNQTRQNIPFVGTGSTKEQIDGDVSRLTYNEEGLIDELKLFLDFGTYFSGGSGAKEYSLANGKIKNVRYYKKNSQVIKLEFIIDAGDFTLFADLSETIQDGFGIRYVGEMTASYRDGTSRKGVLKIELDQKQELVNP